MFAKGYRPMSHEHHVAVISFVQIVYILPSLVLSYSKPLITQESEGTNRGMTKWVQYSPRQAESLVMVAEEFVSRAVELLKKKYLSE